MYYVCDKAEPSRMVAMCFEDHESEDSARNARLFSAAPDLLRVAQQAAAYPHLREAAEAAIRKAGRAQCIPA